MKYKKRYVIILEGEPSEDGTTVISRLRGFLKAARRWWSFRCISIKELK